MGTRRRMSYGAPIPAVVARPYGHYDDIYSGGQHGTQTHLIESRVISQPESDPILQTVSRHPSIRSNWTAQEGVAFSEQQPYYVQGAVPHPAPMSRTLSGTLTHNSLARGCREAEYSFKGPAHRTITRMNNRQLAHQRIGSSSMQWQQGVAGGQYHDTIRRAGSVHSLRSVGRGGDVMDTGVDGSDVPAG